jgi:excinuclease UvrABC nuclease subunit
MEKPSGRPDSSTHFVEVIKGISESPGVYLMKDAGWKSYMWAKPSTFKNGWHPIFSGRMPTARKPH